MVGTWEEATGTTKILIVEDHPIVRAGFAMLLRQWSDVTICGEAESAGEALHLVREQRPDLIIIDLVLKSGSGLELCKQVAHSDPSRKILVISAHNEQLYADRALRSGARGFLNKEEAAAKLLDAVRAVLSGKVWLSPRMTERLLARVGQGDSPPQSPVENLSDRELEVFEMVGNGMTTHQVAARLHLSPKTVESYRENLKRKLGLHNSAQLMQHAVRWSLENK